MPRVPLLLSKSIVFLLVSIQFTPLVAQQVAPSANPNNHFSTVSPSSMNSQIPTLKRAPVEAFNDYLKNSAVNSRNFFIKSSQAFNTSHLTSSNQRSKVINKLTSTNTGSSTFAWEKILKPSEGEYLFELAQHNGQLFVSSTTGRLFTSKDIGQSWTELGRFPNDYSNFPGFYYLYYTSCVAPNTLVATDDMIFFKGDYSLDQGATWKNIFDNSNNYFKPFMSYNNLGINGFLVNNHDIYVYTYGNGIFKTSDYGYTWTSLSSGLSAVYNYGSISWSSLLNIESMMVNNGVLYCKGAYNKNVNYFFYWDGSTWTSTDTINFYHDSGFDSGTILDINTLVVKTSQGYYYSSGEDNWNWKSATNINFPPTGWKPQRILNIDSQSAFATGSDYNLYLTNDNGLTWQNIQPQGSGIQSYSTSLLGVNSKVCVSTTFGFFTSESPYSQWTPSNAGIEQQRFEGMVNINDRLLALSYFGLYESTDDGASWQMIDNELKNAFNHKLFKNGNDLYATSYTQGIMKSADGGYHWTSVNPDSLKYFYTYQGTLCFKGNSVFASGYIRKENRTYNSEVFRSDNGGTTWTRIWNDSISFKSPMTIGTNGESIFIGTNRSGIFESKDNGQSWNPTSNKGLPSTSFTYQSQTYTFYSSVLGISFVGKNMYSQVGDYPFGGTVIYKSPDSCKTWSKVVIDPSMDSVYWSQQQMEYLYNTPVEVNNSLVVYFERGYLPVKPYYYSFFEPTEFTHSYYVSKDNGITWKLADASTSDSGGNVKFLFPWKDKMYSGLEWLAGGLYKIPLQAFGIDPPVEIFATKTHGTKNSELVSPIKTSYFKNILSTQFSINWDPAVATFIDVESFSLNGMNSNSFGVSQVNSGKLTFSWSEPNLSATNLADSSTLFSIRFKLTGKYGAKTKVDINSLPLSIEVIDAKFNPLFVTTTSGKITIDSTISIGGKIFYSNGNEGVQNVSVNLSGGILQNSKTDANGSYYFSAPAGISYDLTPGKANDPNPLNGVDVQDVAAIRRHILGVQPLGSPYQIIAGDVNKSNSLSTLDIDLITALILGVLPNFPNNNQWTFVPSNFQFVDSMNPFPFPSNVTLSQMDGTFNQNFTGIKLGDVNGDRDNSQSTRISSSTDLVFNIIEEKIIDDSQKTIEVPIHVKNFGALSAFQFTIEWDSEKLEFVSSTNPLQLSFGKQRIENGKLTALWDDLSGKKMSIADGSELLSMTFINKNAGTYKDVSFTDGITPIKIYDGNLQSIPYEIIYSESDVSSNSFSVYPIPFYSKINIDFNSESGGNTDFQIIDLFGRVIESLNVNSASGRNHIEWSGLNFVSGLYILNVRGNSKLRSVKIIKN